MGAGRPTKFNEFLASEILELARLGKTDEEIAESVGVSVASLNVWKKTKGGFLEALNSCKKIADSKVMAALFHRATGYSHPAVKIFCSEGQIYSEEYIEHYPPDTTACIFWLKNRQRDQWRDQKDFSIDKMSDAVLIEETQRRIEAKGKP